MSTPAEDTSPPFWPGFLPDGHVLPPTYERRHGSVFHVVERTRNGEQAEPLVYRVTYGPLHIHAMAASTDGDQWFDLSWRDGHRPVTRRVDGTVLRSGRALVRELGRAGFPAIDADAKHLERYLAAYLFTNHDILEASRMTIARHLGWQEDGSTFVTADGAPWPVEPGQPEQRPALAAHHPHGTLGGWKQAVAPLGRYPVALLALSAAFGAPLLPLLHINSFTVDVSGRSSRGKSTAAQAAASAWADPSPLGSAIGTWKSGQIGIEKRLNLVRGLPVVLDETRVVKSPEIVDQVLYQVSMNQGMARGGGYPSELPWHTILISTGEQPALSFTSHEGAAARVLSLRRAPFGTGGQRSADDAQALTDGIRENYGLAGPAFIARLQEQLADPDGAAQLRKQHQALADTHAAAAGNDIARRRAPLVAALHLGLQLAHEWEISPVPAPDTKVWTELLSEEAGREDRGAMGLDVVRALIAAQAHRLYPLNATTPTAHDAPAAGWIGAVVERDGIAATAILPEALAAALSRATPPIALDAVREAWVESGTLILDSRKQNPRVRMSSGRPRAYLFAQTILDGDETDEPHTDTSTDTGTGASNTHHDPV